MFRIFVLLSFAAAYLTRALLFEERVSHYGPWPSRDATVVRIKREGEEITTYKQPVTFFDRLRYWTTRAYEIDHENKEWYVREDRMEMWSCPKCLAFWTSGAIVVPYLLLTGNWKEIPLMWAAVSGASHLAYKLTDVEVHINVNSFYEAATTAMDGDDHEEV